MLNVRVCELLQHIVPMWVWFWLFAYIYFYISFFACDDDDDDNDDDGISAWIHRDFVWGLGSIILTLITADLYSIHPVKWNRFARLSTPNTHSELSLSLSISLSALPNGIDLIRRQATHIHKHRHATIIHRLENLMWRERNFVSPIDTQWCSFLAPEEMRDREREQGRRTHTHDTHTNPNINNSESVDIPWHRLFR